MSWGWGEGWGGKCVLILAPRILCCSYELAVEQYKIEQQQRRREFNVTLPSQEQFYQVGWDWWTLILP